MKHPLKLIGLLGIAVFALTASPLFVRGDPDPQGQVNPPPYTPVITPNGSTLP